MEISNSNKTKICTKCSKEQALENFVLNKNNEDGRALHCKRCTSLAARERRTSKDKMHTVMYQTQRDSSIKRGHALPNYTKDELKTWLFNQSNFDTLYENWVNSNFDKWLKPSIDRLDDYKPYSLDNIQLMTWQENCDKSKSDRKEGKNNKINRSVYQFTIEGEFIKEYHSTREVRRLFKAEIKQRSMKNGIQYAKGYKWTFHKQDIHNV